MRVLVIGGLGDGDPSTRTRVGAVSLRCPVDRRAADAAAGYRCAIGTGSTGSARSKPNTRL